jgi:preprotein translocase subunit SecE
MFKAIGKFFGEVKNELSKVTWPSRAESTKHTIYVIVSTVIAGLVIAGVDYVFSKGLALLIGTK